MRLSQYIDRQPKPKKAARSKSAARPSVITHRSFVPMVTAWGAALLGLSVLVLPAAAIGRIATVFGAGLDETVLRFALAGFAALLGSALAFMIGGAMHSAALRRAGDDGLVTAFHSRRTRPIDPATDLGSESFDAPIEKMPFAKEPVVQPAPQPQPRPQSEPEPALVADKPRVAEQRKPTLGELSKRGYEIEAPEDPVPAKEKGKDKGKPKKSEWAFTHKQFQSALIDTCEGATCEAMAETPAPREPVSKPKPAPAPAPAPLPERPEQLDLAEFAQLPGRNAVWVEAPSERKTQPARPEIPAAGALEKLRQTPPEDLSLVEMVERFAAALHERQAADRKSSPEGMHPRDAALAEALKALTFFTSQGLDQGRKQPLPVSEVSAVSGPDDSRIADTERELREALAKLQDLRGAA